MLQQNDSAQLPLVRSYAIGRLVLWTGLLETTKPNAQTLSSRQVSRIAIANPRLAPYGLAAQQTLEGLGLYESVRAKIVRGENINQAFQFVESGNAQLGFVAYSQLISYQQQRPDIGVSSGSYWMIPESLYAPIRQDAVLLNPSSSVAQFWRFLFSPTAQKIIRESGYKTP